MSSIGDLFKTISQKIAQSPRRLPSAVTIPSEHVEPKALVEGKFSKDEHYFQVRVNEIYLTEQRKWFAVMDPMVYVVSEFIYNRKEQTVPYVVGWEMIQKNSPKIPKTENMMFRDTRVAGLHPYRGGRLTLTVVLCEVPVRNYLRDLLQVVDNASKALNLSIAVSPYAQIASVVTGVFETLLGLNNITPLVALRKEYDPDAGDIVAPGFFALIDEPNVDPQTLWVKEKQLLQGGSLAEAKPYRAADYMLYSLVKDPDNRRSDIDTLPFMELWERVREEASRPSKESYQSARSNMLSLYQTMVLSPDLIPAEAEVLADERAAEMKRLHDRAVALSTRGPRVGRPADGLDRVRGKALSVLEM